MEWAEVGTVQVDATSPELVVGSLTIDSGDTSIWLKAIQTTGQSPWPYGFGLITWRSAAGREMGTAKVWGENLGEVVRLSVGLAPESLTGHVIFTPRSYNLRWIQATAAVWSLQILAKHG